MVSVSSVLMAPVRGVVWLIKLPFVLVWMLLRYIGSCIYRAVAAILRWAPSTKLRDSKISLRFFSLHVSLLVCSFLSVCLLTILAGYGTDSGWRGHGLRALLPGSNSVCRSPPTTVRGGLLGMRVHGVTDGVWYICVHWHVVYTHVLSLHIYACICVHGADCKLRDWPGEAHIPADLCMCV